MLYNVISTRQCLPDLLFHYGHLQQLDTAVLFLSLYMLNYVYDYRMGD